MKKIIVAIDGYSSSGKSTMARRLAARIGYRYIDSGAMYRAVTLYALDNGLIDSEGNIDIEGLTAALGDIHIDFAPAESQGGTQHTLLNGKDVESEIRRLRVSNAVSPIAAIPSVRKALTHLQKEMGKEGGIVMDGRDIGTTVFPAAELKIFVNASAETRARRRFKEMVDSGAQISYEDVLANVVHRDHIDETRDESPLRKAEDAITLDNSKMSIEEQDRWLYERFEECTKSK